MAKPLTNTEKSKALRERRDALGLSELRGIWATFKEKVVLKQIINDKLKELREVDN